MKNNLRTLLAVFALSSSALMAAQVIDQNSPANNAYMAAFAQGDLAQSFKQNASNISGAGIFLQSDIGSSDTVTIGVWNALPNNSGSLLASASAVGNSGNWVDVFWNPISINSGSTYFLVFTSANNTLGIAGSTVNPYADGNVFANSGYGSFPSFDYTFRTYAEDGPTASVPDSATTLPMLATALFGLVAFRQRRKA